MLRDLSKNLTMPTTKRSMKAILRQKDGPLSSCGSRRLKCQATQLGKSAVAVGTETMWFGMTDMDLPKHASFFNSDWFVDSTNKSESKTVFWLCHDQRPSCVLFSNVQTFKWLKSHFKSQNSSPKQRHTLNQIWFSWERGRRIAKLLSRIMCTGWTYTFAMVCGLYTDRPDVLDPSQSHVTYDNVLYLFSS